MEEYDLGPTLLEMAKQELGEQITSRSISKGRMVASFAVMGPVVIARLKENDVRGMYLWTYQQRGRGYEAWEACRWSNAPTLELESTIAQLQCVTLVNAREEYIEWLVKKFVPGGVHQRFPVNGKELRKGLQKHLA